MTKIITCADIHLRNDDSYGVYNADGVNDFLLFRFNAMKEIIERSIKENTHLLIAGDLLDNRILDSHTLYYASNLIKLMSKTKFTILLEGNHGYIERSGNICSISQYKHLAKANVRIITYPKIEEFENISYHCIPAVNDISENFPKLLTEFKKSIKKSKTNILTVHAPVAEATLDSGRDSKDGLQQSDVYNASLAYDYVVLGDFHRHQFIKENVWYCGSIIQMSLKDKDQHKGYQIINTENKVINFSHTNGPSFLELMYEPGVRVSKIIKTPELYSNKLKNSIVVIKIVGKTSIIKNFDIEKLKNKLVENGAIRVFSDVTNTDDKSNRKSINIHTNEKEMIYKYCKYKKNLITQPVDEVVKKGISYLFSR
jgi:DNA repair exonuclease SbcCD nuclease subunit